MIQNCALLSKRENPGRHELSHCIVLYLQPVLNRYDGARVLRASGRPMLVIGRSYVVSIQVEELEETITGGVITKLAEETTE